MSAYNTIHRGAGCLIPISTDMEEFLELKGELVALEDLTELQKKYYDYTCREGDCIRTCMIPSPQLNEDDLEIEKRILAL